jgi:hypothetical protein
MTNRTLKAMAAAALISAATLALPAPAAAGHGDAWGAGLLGFGVGAIIGSTLAPREVYVVPPPPPPAYYYGPVAYGPPPWTPDWYAYCGDRYRSFDPGTGYFMSYDGYPHFCR